MFPPPPDLVEWTKYAGMVVSLITAVLALWSGRAFLRAKTEEIRSRSPNGAETRGKDIAAPPAGNLHQSVRIPNRIP